jgi:soluble lytic murein transglycosylase-like protein
MIEKLTNYSQTGYPDQRESIPSSFSGPGSLFNNMLKNEMSPSDSLERMVLNFLIKTMESIFSKTDQTDQWPSFSRISFLGEGSFQPQTVLKSPLSESGPGLSTGQPKGQEIDEIIQAASDQYGVEPSLIKAVIFVESNGNPRAVSPAGAQGLMQLMPKTAAELGVTDPFDPVQNIKAGTRYLSRLLDRYQGNQKLALAAYNWGLGNLEKNPSGLPKETRNYIVRVEKQYQSYLNSSSTA